MGGADARLVELSAQTATPLLSAGAELFDDPVREDRPRSFLDDPDHLLCFAVADGHPVGFAAASVLLHPDKRPQLFINEIELREEWRRRGSGRALVVRPVEIARRDRPRAGLRQRLARHRDRQSGRQRLLRLGARCA